MSAHVAWRVYLRGMHVDTVFYAAGIDADEVKRGLVSHDGYNPNIEVRKEDTSS